MGRSPVRQFSRLRSARHSAALAGAVLALLACGEPAEPPSAWPLGEADEIVGLDQRHDLNVVFVVIDTLRADHLGAYGYERDTSPIMDRMMHGGVRFHRVRAQSSWTKTSMATATPHRPPYPMAKATAGSCPASAS